jgi:hypothetical protein
MYIVQAVGLSYRGHSLVKSSWESARDPPFTGSALSGSEDSIEGPANLDSRFLFTGGCRGSHAVSGHATARPLEAVARYQHVPDEGLDGRLADEPDEEELLDDGGGDGAEGGEAQQQLAEPGGLVGILGAAVLLQGALRLLLQLLDHRWRRQPDGVWKGGWIKIQLWPGDDWG